MTDYAIIYARRSGSDETSRSIPDQIRECRSLPEVSAFGEHVIVIEDPSLSGANPNRPGLRELQHRLTDRDVRLVAFHHQDRIARDDELNAVMGRLFRGRPDVAVRSVMQGALAFDASGMFLWTLQGAFAAYYRAQVSERIKASKRGVRAAHGFTGNVAPYGYRFTGERAGAIAPDARAEIVRIIFRYAIDGMRLVDIARSLEADGAPAPAGRRGISAGHWSAESVQSILTNGAYICETPYGESGAWEPLVSVTTFKLAAERLQKRRTVRLGTWESSVRGRVRCSCGKLLKWQKPYNTVRGYCASRGTANPCPEAGHCVYERDVIAWFDRLAAGWLREGLSLSQFTTLPVNMEPVLRAEIAELEARLSRVGDRLDLGFIDRDRAKAEATAFRRSIREKEDQLAAIEPADPSLDSWGAQWVAAKPAERRALIGRIFESVTVDANGQVASWTARADRRAGAVDLLIATAFDSGAPEEDLALIPVAR